MIQATIELTDMKKGDILWGENNTYDNGKRGHLIVYLRENDAYTFVGAMLTTKGSYEENILMSPEHFTSGFQYKMTRLVSGGPFIKKMEWGEFRKIGALSKEGVGFVEGHLKREHAVSFFEHKKQQQQ